MKKCFVAVLLAFALALSALPCLSLPEAKAAGQWITTWGSSIVNGSVSIPGLIYLLAYRREEEYQSGMALLDKATNYKLPLRRLYRG